MRAVLLAMVVAAAPAQAAETLKVEHKPVLCVVAGTHPWIEARAAGAVSMRVRFRVADDDAWYGVRLSEEEQGFAGALPAPEASVESFRYVVDAVGADTQTTSSPEASVRVVKPEIGCGTQGVGPSVPTAVVAVDAPEGRPALPDGFGGAAQDGEEKIGMFDIGPHTALIAAVGVGGAAFTAARLVAGDQEVPTQTVEFAGSNPPPGSSIPFDAPALTMRVRATSSKAIPAGTMIVSFRAPSELGWCLTLFASHNGIPADTPTVVELSQFLGRPQCDGPFSTVEVLATVRGANQEDVYSGHLAVSYTFTR